MALFVLCYLVAAQLYPGGSWNEPGKVGFSWRNNYLCDLLDTLAVNGALNTGRYWARAALGFLILGIMVLWFYLPLLTKGSRRMKTLMRYSGLAALATTLLLNSGTHDVTVRLAGALGLTGTGLLLAGLWKNGLYYLALFGLWCLGMFLVNYAIYETGRFLYALPLIQKITFTSFLIWFVWLDFLLWRKRGGSAEGSPGSRSFENQFNP